MKRASATGSNQAWARRRWNCGALVLVFGDPSVAVSIQSRHSGLPRRGGMISPEAAMQLSARHLD
jgi:hypothetical protein